MQRQTNLEFENYQIEKTYNSKYGDIKVDVVLFKENNELFVEPYFTSKIDDNKLQKITDINISTISINLLDFVDTNKWLFTIEQFTSFLINNLENKKWIYIRTHKIESLIDNLLNNIGPKKIDEFKQIIRNNDVLNTKISENEKKRHLLNLETQKLRDELKQIKIDYLFE